MADPFARAVRALGLGKLVVYPTDTLIGLGARAGNARAVGRLLRLKGRPAGAPLSLALSSVEEVEEWAELDDRGRALARRLLPGAVTLLVRPSRRALRLLPRSLVGPRGTVGIRVPDHPVARELVRRAGPVTATSANRHGEAPARSVADARSRFGSRVAVYLSGGPPPSGRPSTLVDLTGRRPRVRIR